MSFALTHLVGFGAKRASSTALPDLNSLQGASGKRLRRTHSSGDRDNWALSFWTKRASTGSVQSIFTTDVVGADEVVFTSGNKIQINKFGGSTVVLTTATYTSTTDWMHVYIEAKTGDATAANRLKLYVDGTEVTAFDTDNRSSLGASSFAIHTAVAHDWMWQLRAAAQYYLGKVAAMAITDGSRPGVSAFGQDVGGTWRAITPTGVTWGTNGSYLDFANSSDIGNDVSGNNNDFTVTSFVSGDVSTTDGPND